MKNFKKLFVVLALLATSVSHAIPRRGIGVSRVNDAGNIARINSAISDLGISGVTGEQINAALDSGLLKVVEVNTLLDSESTTQQRALADQTLVSAMALNDGGASVGDAVMARGTTTSADNAVNPLRADFELMANIIRITMEGDPVDAPTDGSTPQLLGIDALSNAVKLFEDGVQQSAGNPTLAAAYYGNGIKEVVDAARQRAGLEPTENVDQALREFRAACGGR